MTMAEHMEHTGAFPYMMATLHRDHTISGTVRAPGTLPDEADPPVGTV